VVERRVGKASSIQNDVTIEAPVELSFSRNGKETIAFLEEYRKAASAQRKKLVNGKWVWSSLFVDLSPIKRISIPAAIVLSAEFQRWSLVNKTQLRPRALAKWSPRVRRLLYEFGTFDLLGIRLAPVEDAHINALVLQPLSSGEKTDQEQIAQLQEGLITLGLIFESQPFIFDGLSEAVLNCIDHAYVSAEGHTPLYPIAGHRWWATSCYDPVTNALRFFVYDQGVGIRATLDQKVEWRPLIDDFLSIFGYVEKDSAVIKAAFEIGRTRTKLQERGKGLDQMAGVIRNVGSGYMRVLSGRGDVKIEVGGKYALQSLHDELGGTLIEWSLPYGALSTGGGKNA
jgi:hypothetical protein